MNQSNNTRKPLKWYQKERARENFELYIILLPVIVLIVVFFYLPMYGIVIAFQDYTPGLPFIGEGVKWVGLKHFQTFIQGKYFMRLMKNTILLSLYNLIFGFPVPIIFSLLLNEIQKEGYKKTCQTLSYLPYFISWVVVAGMVLSFLRPGGLINQIIMLFGGQDSDLTRNAKAFPIIYTSTNIWKSFGFSSILYLSSITAIDPTLYESASIDGASRLQKAIYITLPSIMPTIAITLIMQVGGLMGANSDLILNFYNPSIYETADVIGTYIFRDGILGGRFSYSAAVGLFASVINFVLVFLANKVSNRITDYGIW